MQPDEQSSEVLRSSPTLTGEEEKVISVYEEAFKRIKEATGVTDIQVGGVDGGVCFVFFVFHYTTRIITPPTPTPKLWTMSLNFFQMFAALIKVDIIKHSPVLFSSLWDILEHEIHF